MKICHETGFILSGAGVTHARVSTRRTPPWASHASDPRANNFDAIRLLLALCVIVSHAWPLIWMGRDSRVESGEPIAQWSHGQTTLGSICVNGFFVLSGYLILASRDHCRQTSTFLARRVRRIYPAYVLAALLCYLLAAFVGAGWTHSPARVIKEGAHLAMLQFVRVEGAFADNALPETINGSMWTIQHEFYCYLLVAAAGTLILSRKRIAGPLLVCLAVGLSVLAASVAAHGWEAPQSTFSRLIGRASQWPRLLSHFLAGMAFYVGRNRIPWSNRWAAVAAALFVFGAVTTPLFALVSPLTTCYLMMWAGHYPRVRLHWVGRWGDISYGTYLYSFPIQQTLIYTGWTRTVGQSIALAIPLTLIAGLASWHLCEKHFVAGRSQKQRREPMMPVRLTFSGSPAALAGTRALAGVS